LKYKVKHFDSFFYGNQLTTTNQLNLISQWIQNQCHGKNCSHLYHCGQFWSVQTAIVGAFIHTSLKCLLTWVVLHFDMQCEYFGNFTEISLQLNLELKFSIPEEFKPICLHVQNGLPSVSHHFFLQYDDNGNFRCQIETFCVQKNILSTATTLKTFQYYWLVNIEIWFEHGCMHCM
jgi:hypothetical protein